MIKKKVKALFTMRMAPNMKVLGQIILLKEKEKSFIKMEHSN